MNSLNKLEEKMSELWADILNRPAAQEIQRVLASGDRKLYGMWLSQVAHLTYHTSAHQALVGTRLGEISHQYMKFCFEHALEEVGHEMMALSDLRKLNVQVNNIRDLPPPLPATDQLNAFLYYASEKMHPNTRLGFSYWAEKCYPFIQGFADSTKESLGLTDSQMSFFVSHSKIDEKHARDVENIIERVCKIDDDWNAVITGMNRSLELAVNIFEEIFATVKEADNQSPYWDFIQMLEGQRDG